MFDLLAFNKNLNHSVTLYESQLREPEESPMLLEIRNTTGINLSSSIGAMDFRMLGLFLTHPVSF